MKVSLQIHKMQFDFHWAFALGAVNGLFTFRFTVHSQCAIFLALRHSAQWPVPILIKENNQFGQNFHPIHCLFLHSHEFSMNVTTTTCFLWNVLWLVKFFASLCGVWFHCWLLTCLWRLNCNNSFIHQVQNQKEAKNHKLFFHCCWALENNVIGFGLTNSQLWNTKYGS